MAQARVYGVPGLSCLLLAGGCFVAFEKEGTKGGEGGPCSMSFVALAFSAACLLVKREGEMLVVAAIVVLLLGFGVRVRRKEREEACRPGPCFAQSRLIHSFIRLHFYSYVQGAAWQGRLHPSPA